MSTRREFIGLGVGGVASVALGGAFWDDVFGSVTKSPPRKGPGYGPRGATDEHGIRLPQGFRSRMIARGEQTVPGTGYRWHVASDGSAAFPADGGGCVLVSNSETVEGGASAIRFAPDGRIDDAYRILEGTTANCSGGGTPWGTWLSCEEIEGGHVWECDPGGKRKGVRRPAMGSFKHEAAAVDPRERRVYMTEDLVDGGFYRFTPTHWPHLDEGLLEVATKGDGGRVGWKRVPDPAARKRFTRRQVPGTIEFRRGEGIWHDKGTVYIATTEDCVLHAYDTRTQRFHVLYDGLALKNPPLLCIDQLTANRAGEVFVCEDMVADEIDIGLVDSRRRISKFLSITGPDHHGSELTGATFDPTGSRLYFSSQRAFGSKGVEGPGAIYEISGPFRGRRA